MLQIGMYTIFPKQLSLLSILLVGCATPELDRSGPPAEMVSETSLSPGEITNRLDYWREEAMELHDMARRREREADVLLKNQEGASAEELVKRMRTLAKHLHAAAEYADEQAQDTQRQGMTQ